MSTSNEYIYLSPPDVTDYEEAFVVSAIRSGWVAPVGPEIDAFEREVADRVGRARAVGAPCPLEKERIFREPVERNRVRAGRTRAFEPGGLPHENRFPAGLA